MRHCVLAAALLGGAVATLSASASAQEARGFYVDRFDPSARGSEWFVMDTLDMRGSFRPALGAIAEWSHNPLVIYNKDGSKRDAILADQVGIHVGGSINLVNRLRLNVDVPVFVYQTGDGGSLNGVRYPAPTSNTTIGDVRVGGDVRIVGEYRSPFSLAGGVDLYLPTGTEGSYTSEGSVRFQPHAIIAGEVSAFVYSARVGAMYRNRTETYAGQQLGSELTYGAAAGVRIIDGHMVIGPEIYGSSVFTGFFDKKSTPLEALLGTHITLGKDFRISAGFGGGLARGFGSPETRVILGLEWAPATERPDHDGDGIYDDEDACPDVAGTHSDDPKKNGCPVEPPPPPPPPPSDRDKDGIIDDQDACPDNAGPADPDPKKNGCPDRDKDGIIDIQDACPDTPGVADKDPAKNGCPPDPDRDKDGIPNEQDACPDDPGKPSKDPKRNGCPQAFVKDGQIKILDQVKFATNSTAIVPGKDSEGILLAVKDVLDKHPEIQVVRVEGHTDNRGNPAANQKLSEGRAASVVKWLVKHGIAQDRLKSQGFGQDRPMSDNSTEEGRRENRRVEFHIEKEEKSQ